MTKNEARKKTRELIRRSTDRMRKNIEEMRNFQPTAFSQYKKQIKKDAKNIYACI